MFFKKKQETNKIFKKNKKKLILFICVNILQTTMLIIIEIEDLVKNLAI